MGFVDLVLVGGGHAHAIVLRGLAMRPVPGVRCTVVSDSSHAPYSGMLPGYITGLYGFKESHIDIALLAEWAGAVFVCDEVTDVDVNSKEILRKDGPPIGYDLLSLNIGSHARIPNGGEGFGTAIKPLRSFLKRWEELSSLLKAGAAPSIVFVGAGTAGVELAVSLQHHFPLAKVTLVERSTNILSGTNGATQKIFSRELGERGITVYTEAEIVRFSENEIVLHSGETLSYDFLFFSTGSKAPPWIERLPLKKDENGFLLVEKTLQVVGQPEIFVAGDLATVIKNPRAKSGVFAVRHGKILLQNLRAKFTHKPLVHYKPQKRWLSLISLPHQNGWGAVLTWGRVGFKARWLWKVKQYLDRSFIEKFQNLPQMQEMPKLLQDREDGVPTDKSTADRNRFLCKGCGGKVPLSSLQQFLSSERLAEDVAIVATQAPILQSVDTLTPIVSDPYLLGRIAVVHACSDIYAAGGVIHSALCSLGVPHGSRAVQSRIVAQCLAGIERELGQVNAQCIGGHNYESHELTVSLTINGTKRFSLVSQPQTAERTYDIILTKPLGIGVLFAGRMHGKTESRWIEEALPVMLQHNDRAAEVLYNSSPLMLTDVTGFGLLNHLLLALHSATGGLIINLQSLPLFHGVSSLIEQGILSTLWNENLDAAQSLVEFSPHPEPEWKALFDPQTSGGLLAAIPQEKSKEVLSQLKNEALIIGTFQQSWQSSSLSITFQP